GDLEEVIDTLAPQGLFRAEQMMPVVKSDAEQSAGRQAVNWELDTWEELMNDPGFQEALGYMLKDKKAELSSVGDSLSGPAKGAFQHGVLDQKTRRAGLNVI